MEEENIGVNNGSSPQNNKNLLTDLLNKIFSKLTLIENESAGFRNQVDELNESLKSIYDKIEQIDNEQKKLKTSFDNFAGSSLLQSISNDIGSLKNDFDVVQKKIPASFSNEENEAGDSEEDDEQNEEPSGQKTPASLKGISKTLDRVHSDLCHLHQLVYDEINQSDEDNIEDNPYDTDTSEFNIAQSISKDVRVVSSKLDDVSKAIDGVGGSIPKELSKKFNDIKGEIEKSLKGEKPNINSLSDIGDVLVKLDEKFNKFSSSQDETLNKFFSNIKTSSSFDNKKLVGLLVFIFVIVFGSGFYFNSQLNSLLVDIHTSLLNFVGADWYNSIYGTQIRPEDFIDYWNKLPIK